MLSKELKAALKIAEQRNHWTKERKQQQINLVTEIVKRSKFDPHVIHQMILAYGGEPNGDTQ